MTNNFTYQPSDSCNCKTLPIIGTNFTYSNCSCQVPPQTDMNMTWNCSQANMNGFLNCTAFNNCYCRAINATNTT